MKGSEKYSILIVDDEKSNLIELTDILEDDYDVLLIRDSREAVKTAERKMPDVILLDILMPEMDGYEVITALKNSGKTRSIPVVFITGLDNAEAEEKGFALGAADYIPKPFHSATVKMRVKNQIEIVERHRQQTLMIQISHKFISDAHTGKQFSDTLQMVGEFMNLSQVLLYETGDSENELNCRYEWLSPELNSETRINEKLTVDEPARLLINNILSRGKLCIHSNEPAYREATKKYRKIYNSFITAPIFIKNKLCAVIDFSCEDYRREWKGSEIDLAVLVSGILSNVYEREAMERRYFVTEYDLMKHRLAGDALNIAHWDMMVASNEPASPDNIIIWSQEFRRMIGFSDERDFPNVLGSLTDRLHPEDAREVFGAFAAHFNDRAGKTPFSVEHRLMMKNGDYRYFHVFGETLRDAEGAPLRIAGAFMDIDEKKRAEERIEQMNERMMLMLDTSPLSIGIWDSNCSIIDCNKATLEFYKFKNKQEYIDRFLSDCLPEYQPDGQRSGEKAAALLSKAFDEGYCSFEWTLRIPADDILVPTEVTLVRTKYRDDNIVIGYTRDLREHYKLMETIEKSNLAKANTYNAMESILNGLDAMIYVTVPETGEILFINDLMREHYGIEGSGIGQVCYEVFQDGLNARCSFCPCIRLEKNPGDVVVWEENSTLTKRTYRNTDCFIDWTDGRIVHLQNSVDVTELVSAREQAQAASQAKSDFLANMSHEMRTPLNAIIGMTLIGKKAEKIEGKLNALNKIGDASSHLLGIVSDILDMAKIEADKLELFPVEYNFEHMLEKTLSVIHFRADEKQQTLTVNMDKGIPRFIIGDDQRLAQVIANLLSNAVKFTPEGGNIRLDILLAGKTDGHCDLRVEVTDSGIGISPEQQEHLFLAFEQGDNSTSREYGGTGLGLSISKRIINIMGGRIWVESESGKGAKFIFTVKAACGQQNAAAGNHSGASVNSPADPGEISYLKGKRLLVAEDIEINREILIALLEDSGLIIDCAENGREALDMVTAEPEKYDIIFMDLQMPQMGGLEATRLIRSLPARKLPIIAMTANVFKDDIAACFAAGMDGHLGKPLDFDKVLEVLKRHLIDASHS